MSNWARKNTRSRNKINIRYATNEKQHPIRNDKVYSKKPCYEYIRAGINKPVVVIWQ